MKFSELRGRAVVSLDTATKIGEVEDLLLDPNSRETVGVKVKTGLFGGALVVPIEHIKSVGADAVTVVGTVSAEGALHTMEVSTQVAPEATGHAPADATMGVTADASTEAPTDAAMARVAPGTSEPAATGAQAESGQPMHAAEAVSVPLSAMFSDKVLTDEGTLLGDVQDVLVDPATLKVTGLVVRAGGVFSKPKEISLTPEVRYGEKLIAVPKGLVD